MKQIMQLLSKEAGDVDMLAPPWGRSFHRATKKCDPVVATSVQIHIRVAKSEMRRILKASGCSGVYCTPKTEDRKILADFMIIWLNQTPVDFAGSLSRVDFHCGVVRSSKGDSSSKGVRFEKADYLKAFALLKPDEKLPALSWLTTISKLPQLPWAQHRNKYSCGSKHKCGRPSLSNL